MSLASSRYTTYITLVLTPHVTFLRTLTFTFFKYLGTHDKTRKKPLMKRSVPFFVSKAGFSRAHARKKHEKRHVDRSTLMFQTAERRVIC